MGPHCDADQAAVQASESKNYVVKVVASPDFGDGASPGLDFPALSHFAAEFLTSLGKKDGLHFVDGNDAKDTPVNIVIRDSQFFEDVSVQRGQNVTEYWQRCHISTDVTGTSPSGEQFSKQFEKSGSVLKKKEGTETYSSPTKALDETIEFNSMFPASLYGRTFSGLLTDIYTALAEGSDRRP